MNFRFAERMQSIRSSTIRELLKLTEQPDVISFAGGLPAPEHFPVEELKEITLKILEEKGCQSLQYSTTEGYPPLREFIAKRLALSGIDLSPDNILIISGSQQGLDFSGKIFLNKGDKVICESPTYLGAINAFNAYQPQYVEVAMDEEGMSMEELEKTLATHPDAKFIYAIPDFQNPTGRTMSLERRKRLVELANHYSMPIIEDNPYGELRFIGERLPAIKHFDTQGLVVYLGTFSKTFCPGLRIGWVAAHEPLLQKYNLVKQAADLHTSINAQIQAAEFITRYDLDKHIAKIKETYKKRRNLMVETMKKEFPITCRFTLPEGGLFTWVELPEGIDATEVLKKALEKKVAFVPGGDFFPNKNKTNYCRLNYSNASEEKIIEGIKRLGQVLREM